MVKVAVRPLHLKVLLDECSPVFVDCVDGFFSFTRLDAFIYQASDFGLARGVEAEPESESVTWGTPYYVAPEKIKRERETFLSDMYSLGGTLYHALTGHVPFEAPTVEELVAAHVHTPLTPPNLVVPEISQATSDALVRVLAKEPKDRFLSYDEFVMALTAARSTLLVRQYSDTQTKGGKTKTSWWRR